MRIPNTAFGGSDVSAQRSTLSRSRTGMGVGATGKPPPLVFVQGRANGGAGPGPPSTRVGGSGARGHGGEQSAGAEAPRAEVGVAWAAALLVWLEDDHPHRNFTWQRCRLLLLRMQPTQGPWAGV